MVSDPKSQQPLVRTDEDVHMDPSVSSLTELLEGAFPSSLTWKAHKGMGIPYYELGCKTCATYILHVVTNHIKGNPSLGHALDEVYKHYIKCFI